MKTTYADYKRHIRSLVAEYHMHVVLNLPHFHAPPVDLEIIFKLIVANFYSPDVYSRQIIGQEIHLTV